MRRFGLLLTKSQLAFFCALLLVLGANKARAQDGTSFSPSVSDPFSMSDDADGFDSSFDSQTSNLTNPYLRTDISDPTNANLTGSSISPLDLSAYVVGSSFAAPDTKVLTDEQQAVSHADPYFGGRQSRSFAAGQAQNFRVDRNSSQSGSGLFSTGTEQHSFANNTGGRAAFSEQSAAQTSATSFSGEGVLSGADAIDDGLGLSLPNTRANLASGLATASPGGGETGPAPPSSQVADFFRASQTNPSATQYDDGQTPLLGVTVPAGQVQPLGSLYTGAMGGFPDSTRGAANLPSQAEISSSPFEKTSQSSGVSPFPAISEGDYYGKSQYLSPNLGAVPVQRSRVPLNVVKDQLKKAERKRVALGMPYSQAAQIYHKDLTDYLRYGSKGKTRLPGLTDSGDQSSPVQTSLTQGMPH